MAKKRKKAAPRAKRNAVIKKEDIEGIDQQHVGTITSRGKREFEIVLCTLLFFIVLFGGISIALHFDLLLSLATGTSANYNFEVSDSFLSLTIAPGQNDVFDVQVTNVASVDNSYTVTVSGIDHIVQSVESVFVLKPGQAKILPLQADTNVDVPPGLYSGSIEISNGVIKKEVLLSIAILTEGNDFVFDLNPGELGVEAGSELQTEVYFVSGTTQTPANLEYRIIDSYREVIFSTTESRMIDLQSSFFVSSDIPSNARSGTYLFQMIAEQNGIVSVQSFSFDVIGTEFSSVFWFCNKNILCTIESTLMILFIITALLYFYFFFGTIVYRLIGGNEALIRKLEEVGEPVLPHLRKKRKPAVQKTPAVKQIRRYVQSGERLLSKSRMYRAEKMYDKVMRHYVLLTYEEKVAVFAEVDSFYKKIHEILEASYAYELTEKKRKIEEKNNETGKNQTIAVKDYKELEEDLEKLDSIEKPEEKVTDNSKRVFSGIFGRKEGSSEKANKKSDAISELRKGKSRRFVKCHTSLLSAKEYLKKKDFENAGKDYKKAWSLYVDLQYDEKKIVYKDLLQVYKKVTTAKKK